MPDLSDETLQYLRACPYFAMTEGRDQMAQDLFYAKFQQLPDEVRTFLLAPETADEVTYLVTVNRLGEEYETALGKIVASVALGEVPLGSIGMLLEKLALTPDQAAQVAQGLTDLLEPIMTAKAKAVVGPAPKQIPPLTRTVGGIIDLRKPPAA